MPRAISHASRRALSSALETAQVRHVSGCSGFRNKSRSSVVGRRLAMTTAATMQAEVGDQTAFLR
jgi:hypothetical protein